MTLTKKILSTAGQTGSTQDLRVLLQDALALTEKLDSVSTSVARPTSSSSQRVSASSVFLHSPVAKSPRSPRSPVVRSSRTISETSGSVFRAQSLGNELDQVGRSPPFYATLTSSAGAAALATPLRKTPPISNGHTSPPLSSVSASRTPQRGSPLLTNSLGSSGDYAVPRPASASKMVPQHSPAGSREGTGQRERQPERESDSVDVGMDCIAQLEALERELKSLAPAESPGDSRSLKSECGDGVRSGRVEESHYEVDPLYMPRKSQCMCCVLFVVCVCVHVHVWENFETVLAAALSLSLNLITSAHC